MKFIFILLFAASAVAAPLSVSVSIPPLKGLVNEIAGDYIKAESLMGEMTDPHGFSISPGQLAVVRNADLVLITGNIHFEENIAKIRPSCINPIAGIAF